MYFCNKSFKKAPKQSVKIYTHLRRIGANRMINESSDDYRIDKVEKNISRLYLVTDCRGHVRISKLMGPLVIKFLEIISIIQSYYTKLPKTPGVMATALWPFRPSNVSFSK